MFQIAGISAAGPHPRALTTGDFDRDGNLDLAVTDFLANEVQVLLNKGNGTYNAGTLITSMTAINAADNHLAFGDFNGNGKMDIAVTTGETLNDVYVLLGNGNGTFGTPIQTVAPYSIGFAAAADFNKDGKLDLAIGVVPPTSGATTMISARGERVSARIERPGAK